MKTTIQLLTFWIGACAACAQGTLQVLPGGYANVEGNSASGDLFRTNASIFQQAYAASAFSFLGGATGRIDGMSFRFDGGTNQSFIGIWPSISISVMTTPRDPDLLSTSYSQNSGSDAVGVYNGSLTLVSPSESGLRSFQVQIPFQTPFFYDPNKGNLSVLIGTTAGPTDLFLDAVFISADSVGRVFGGFSTTGTTDTLGLVTRFNITPIPEPNTLAIALGMSICWMSFHRQRRRHRKGVKSPPASSTGNSMRSA